MCWLFQVEAQTGYGMLLALQHKQIRSSTGVEQSEDKVYNKFR